MKGYIFTSKHSTQDYHMCEPCWENLAREKLETMKLCGFNIDIKKTPANISKCMICKKDKRDTN